MRPAGGPASQPGLTSDGDHPGVTVIPPPRSAAAGRPTDPRRADRAGSRWSLWPDGRWGRLLRVVLVALLAFGAVVGISVGRALTAPGTDSVAARLAEWGRGHGMSSVIDTLERLTYQAPKVGGAPVAGPLAQAPAPSASPSAAATASPTPSPTAPPLAPVAPFAAPPLPGEGSWKVVATVAGKPALQVAYLRPDAVHTSYTSGVVWMDPSLLRFVLHPGTQEPGGTGWSQPPQLTEQERATVVGAFNGGFRMDAARGGYFDNGRTSHQLRVGAASFVITADGRGMVGQWGRDIGPGPSVVSVRQNLDLIVDNGAPVPGLDNNAGNRWGATLGNAKYVWRSGVGQTASGALVYVAGDRLSADTLADLLVRAGAVRAMELDINTQWTSYVLYTPSPRNLLPDMVRAPDRYDTTGTRDFIAVLRRSP